MTFSGGGGGPPLPPNCSTLETKYQTKGNDLSRIFPTRGGKILILETKTENWFAISEDNWGSLYSGPNARGASVWKLSRAFGGGRQAQLEGKIIVHLIGFEPRTKVSLFDCKSGDNDSKFEGCVHRTLGIL